MNPVLEARNVSKRFGGIAALDDVSLDVGVGEAVGLVGPNGAGKTTLFDCLSGVLRPDAGRVVLEGHDITTASVHGRARLGLGRTFQRVEVFAGMTARDHLALAAQARRGDGSLWRDLVNRGLPGPGDRSRVDALIELLALGDVADAPVEALSLGHRRLVELGRALAADPKVILLDEPSSGLDRVEATALATVLDTARRVEGIAMLLVEHDLDLVVRVVERLVVLDYGIVIASGPTDDVLAEPAVRAAYVGTTP